MLFLTKKTMVAVVALGCLLSIPRVQADSPVSGRTVAAVAAALGAVYVGVREVDNSKKEKATHIRALDTVSSYWQSLLNTVTSKKGLVALGGAAGLYAVVKHGSDVTKLPAVQWLVSQVTPATP